MKCVFCGKEVEKTRVFSTLGYAPRAVIKCYCCCEYEVSNNQGSGKEDAEEVKRLAEAKFAEVSRKVEMFDELVTALSEVLPLMDDWKYPNGIMDKIKRGRDVLRNARGEEAKG